MERLIEMAPAFDRRDSDPSKNYGIHGVEMRFVLKGPEGAVQFLLYTDWQLPHVARELKGKGHENRPMPADIGYHSPTPRYDGQTPRENCEYLGGKTCYYDGSGCWAYGFFERLLEGGSDGLWKALECYYKRTFREQDHRNGDDCHCGDGSAYERMMH